MRSNSNENSLVSIIVPAYNVQDYIEECIASLCVQTYKNIEIILVDDGSTDKTGDLCDIAMQKDARVKVVHQKNGGVVRARKSGLNIARGKYVSFVDSDDWLELNAIETLYNTLIEQEVDVVRCNYFISDGLGNDLPALLQEFNSNKKYLNNLISNETFRNEEITKMNNAAKIIFPIPTARNISFVKKYIGDHIQINYPTRGEQQ